MVAFVRRVRAPQCCSSGMGIYDVPAAWEKSGPPFICDISAGSLLRRELFRVSLHKRYSSWRQPVTHRCSTRLLWCAASSFRAHLAPWPSLRTERCLVSPALHVSAGKPTIPVPSRCVCRLTNLPQSPIRLQPRCLRGCPGDERLWQAHGRLHREFFENGLAGIDP
jgi:hypothetical protein